MIVKKNGNSWKQALQVINIYIYIYIYIQVINIHPFSETFSFRNIYIGAYFCLAERTQACMTNFLLLNVRKVSS